MTFGYLGKQFVYFYNNIKHTYAIPVHILQNRLKKGQPSSFKELSVECLSPRVLTQFNLRKQQEVETHPTDPTYFQCKSSS